MPYYFSGPDGKHEHADTVHGDRDCGHLRGSDRVYGISYVPDGASTCGSCGPAETDGDDDDGDDADDDPEIEDVSDPAENADGE